MTEDWVKIELGKVCDYSKGKKPKVLKKEYSEITPFPYVNIKAFEKGIFEEYTDGEKCNLCQEGDLLMVWDGARAGLTGKAKKGAIGSTLMKIEPKNGIEKNYLFYFLLSLYRKLNTNPRGVGIPHVEPRLLWNSMFLMPDIPTQRAIVTKIENLVASLDKGIADLKKAQEQLKVYRQAVLKKAFEESPDTERKKISDIVLKVQIGPFGSQLHKEDYITNGIPLINPMHIQDGKIKPSPSYSISEEKRNSLPNYILEKDDVIMGRRGEMGRCGLVDEKEVGWFCGTGSLYLRPNKEIVYAPFLFYYLTSSIVKEFLTGSAAGTTMMNLNKKIVSSIPIFLPKTIKEQLQRVKDIETRLSVCDKVEQNITEGLEKSEALRQSILKKAFEGKLLSEVEIEKCKQEADYEPASVLLEKIKMEEK